MSTAVVFTRMDHAAAEFRALAAKSDDADQARRLLAIAMIVEGTSRLDAARQTGMDRQTLRDCVHHYNETGIDGLVSRKPRGAAPKLTSVQMAELRELSPAPSSTLLGRLAIVGHYFAVDLEHVPFLGSSLNCGVA